MTNAQCNTSKLHQAPCNRGTAHACRIHPANLHTVWMHIFQHWGRYRYRNLDKLPLSFPMCTVQHLCRARQQDPCHEYRRRLRRLGTPLRDIVTEGVTTKPEYIDTQRQNKPLRRYTAASEQKRTLRPKHTVVYGGRTPMKLPLSSRPTVRTTVTHD
jgi:hypothetical protein